MHEYSIVQALVERVEQEAAARHAESVDRIVIRIGEMAGVDVDLLTTAYLLFRDGTLCAHAPLEIATVAAEWTCRECGTRIVPGAPLRCVACGGTPALRKGDEILLERIEMEVADVPA